MLKRARSSKNVLASSSVKFLEIIFFREEAPKGAKRRQEAQNALRGKKSR